MKFELTSSDYIEYLEQTAVILNENRDVVTELDSLLGDGDHFVNLYSGYEKILADSDKLKSLPIPETLKNIGMILLSGVGGSSGLLYGSAYIACSKCLSSYASINDENFEIFIESMVNEIKKRGQVNPGDKTMLDSLFQALEAYKLAKDDEIIERLKSFKTGAINGMNETKPMIAQKGRGRYHTNKGVGIIDAGAMTMALQLESLANYIIRKIERES